MATTSALLSTSVFLVLLLQAQAVKVAVVSNGDYNDFGWTYAAVDGLRQMERALKMHGCDLIPNILEDTALPTIQGLIDSHYDLIISVTGEHTTAIYKLAPLYPNTYFVVYSGNPNKNYTNVSGISFSMNQMNYIFGYTAGLISQTGKVGIVTPASNGTANTFFLGMQNANPAVELYHVAIDTYLDPDRSSGASAILLQQGIDVLCQQQDDLTVPVFAINHGMLGFGTNGIRLATLFGENVATSVLRNWTSAFINIVNMVNQGTWKQTGFSGTFKNGMLVLDSFSYLIPDPVVQQILVEKDLLVNGTRNITSPTGSRRNPAIRYLGIYEVPLTEVTFPNSFVVGLAVVTSILLAFTIAAAIGIVVLREDQHIWSSSPIFCVVIIFGAIMCYISVLLRLPTPTEELCHATVWLVTLGYSTILAPLIAKNFRIWRIFDNPKLQDRSVTNGTLFAMSSVVWLGTILLLAVWSGIGGVGIDQTPGSDSLGKYEYRTVCSQSWDGDSVWIAILLYHGVLLLFGSFISYKIRTVSYELFNESKSIAMCIYNISFCLCVIIPIIIAVPDQVSKVTLFCVGVLFSTSTTLGILFIPKFWGIVVEGFSVHPILSTKHASAPGTEATEATATGRSSEGQA